MQSPRFKLYRLPRRPFPLWRAERSVSVPGEGHRNPRDRRSDVRLLGQVLGENFAICGFDTVHEFVAAMMESEANHLQAMVDFIKGNRPDDDLRRHAWAPLERGYNDPGYQTNQYDTKLSKAFAKWQKIPDTKCVPGEGLKSA